ncbi:HipA N-terminal domain-containing protein [Candidatus Poriferisodalis sp.]|uniref:HipA N-terminal domain-containing protein n=1 Tax=Candidatus Poriferisodalis sp. TaxID=3101277 RepID=UPI003B0195AD
MAADSAGRTTFTYSAACLHDQTVPLSLSVPLGQGLHRIDAWLDGILPDNPDVRVAWAEHSGAKGSQPVDLLATQIGLDCAGAARL